MARDIGEIQKDLRDAQVQKASHEGQIVQYTAYLQAWQNQGGNSQEKQNAIINWTRAIAESQSALQSDIDRIAALTKELENAMKAEQALADARAKAESEGLTGAAAEQRAKALVEEAQTRKWAIIILVAVVAIIILVWAWIKFKKVK